MFAEMPSSTGQENQPPDPLSKEELDEVQRATFDYLTEEVHCDTGLVADSSLPGSPCSIAAVGMALSCYPVGAERGWLSRRDALCRCLCLLRFLAGSEQSRRSHATGYLGFYYHFLDMESGRRTWRSELSTLDTAILMAGALTAAAYFDRDTGEERELRDTVEMLYHRVQWNRLVRRRGLICHGWKPERGYLPYDYAGYSEALLLYILALGAESHAVEPQAYENWCSSYAWQEHYGLEYFHAGPLFIHQLPQVWLDLRNLQDAPMRRRGLDYPANSRRATLAQIAYAGENPLNWCEYGPYIWGITASDGPGPARRRVNGRLRRFWGYRARGIPDGPDDGTVAPWAVICSLPFAPEHVLRTMNAYRRAHPRMMGCYGYSCCYNPSYLQDGEGWLSGSYHGLDQGPVVLMIENYRSGMVWDLLRSAAPVRRGLERAGFKPAVSPAEPPA